MNKNLTYALLSFGLIITLLTVFILLEESKNYIFENILLPNGSAVFFIEDAGSYRFYLEPDPESGWGYPDTIVSALITGPSNLTVLSITNYEFSTYGGLLETGGEGYGRMSREFIVNETGEYEIIINSETSHIEGFYVKIELLG